MPDFTFVSWSL